MAPDAARIGRVSQSALGAALPRRLGERPTMDGQAGRSEGT